MSKKKKGKHLQAPEPKAAVVSAEPETKGTNRWVMLILAIFCLVIFSITGPMTRVLTSLIHGGPSAMAKVELPRGTEEISLDDYHTASQFLSWRNRFGRREQQDTEDIIAYATERKLAEQLGIYVSDQQLRQYLSALIAQSRVGSYRELWARAGFRNALDFENLMRELMRVDLLESVLASGVGATDEEAIAAWQKDYQEIRYEFVNFSAESFAEQAAALDPSDEDLAAFYPDQLNPAQRSDLEKEEAVAFEGILVSADALQTDVVKAWAPQDEPTEDALQGFYDYRRFSLYLRDSDDPQSAKGDMSLSREELGDRLIRDYELNRAALALLADAGQAEDLQAFAREKGVEYFSQPDPVPSSELPDLPRIGSRELRQLSFSDLNEFLDHAILTAEGVAYLVRPTQQVPRTMPELAEVREQVVADWRKGKQFELAQRAAEDFLASLPKPEGWVEGDPIPIDQPAFAAAVAARGQVIQVQDWVSKQTRPATDPKWGPEDRLHPWLRNQVGGQLEDLEDGQLLGPLNNATLEASVVVHLLARRDPDPKRIWPSELDAARRIARNQAQQRFFQDGLSYEGLAKAFHIEKLAAASDQG